MDSQTLSAILLPSLALFLSELLAIAPTQSNGVIHFIYLVLKSFYEREVKKEVVPPVQPFARNMSL
jgi:hypothetical protein